MVGQTPWSARVPPDPLLSPTHNGQTQKVGIREFREKLTTFLEAPRSPGTERPWDITFPLVRARAPYIWLLCGQQPHNWMLFLLEAAPAKKSW